MSMVQIYGWKKSMEIIMKLDNYELSSIHYTLFYYMDNANLDEDEMEWIGLLRDKVENIMELQMNYDMECG